MTLEAIRQVGIFQNQKEGIMKIETVYKDCACLDSDARRCFELRYQGTTPENEMLMSTEVCGCTCHDKGMDFDGDDCKFEFLDNL